MIDTIINISLMLICLVLKYLLKFQTGTPKGTSFSLQIWWKLNGVDFIISVLCLPIVLGLSNSFIHYLNDIDINTVLITDRVVYALGGYMGSDLVKGFFKMVKKVKG